MTKRHLGCGIGTVIRMNIRRVLSNTVYLFGVLLLVLAVVFLLLYQEKTDSLSGTVRRDALVWSLEQAEPLEALSELREQIFDAYMYTYKPAFADNPGEEIRIINETSSYLEDCAEYEAWLEDTIDSAQTGVSFATQSYEMRLRDMLTARQYEKLRGVSVQAGNYIAWEKFFEPGIAEAALVLLILYTVYYMAVIEREKGMNALIHATTGGGRTYFFCKLTACAAVVSLLFVLVTGSKLAIYLGLYGSSSLSCPVQGLDGYLGSPFFLSVGEYALIYIAYQYLFNLLLMIIMLMVAAFALSEASICIVLAVLGAVSVVCSAFIHDYSKWHILKDISLVSLQNTGYWFSHMYFWYIGSVGNQDIYLQSLELPLALFLIYAVGCCLIGSYLYGRGLKTGTEKKGVLSRLWNYRGRLAANELQYILLQKKTCVVGIAAVLFFAASSDYKGVESDALRYEKSIRQTLNQMDYENALEWLEQKEEEYQQLHREKNELLNKLMEGSISAENYEAACTEIERQLLLEETVKAFTEQSAYLSVARQATGHDIPFAYKTLFDFVFGENGKYERLLCAILTAFFVILAVLPVMPMDRQSRFSFLIGSTPNAQKVVRIRLLWMMCQVFLVAFSIQSIWLYSLGCRYEWLGWNLPLQSWERYSGVTGNCSLGAAVCINAVFYGFGWAVFSGFLAALTLFSSSAIWMEMLGILFLIGPLMLNLLDVNWVKNVFYTRWMIFGQHDFLLGIMPAGSILLLAVAAYVLVRRGWERWIQ